MDARNRLDSHVVSAKMINTFKKRLDEFLDSEGKLSWNCFA